MSVSGVVILLINYIKSIIELVDYNSDKMNVFMVVNNFHIVPVSIISEVLADRTASFTTDALVCRIAIFNAGSA